MVAMGERERERDGLGVWGWPMQTITFRMDKQGPNVYRELYSTIFNILSYIIMEKNIKKNVYMCVTESLGCTAEIGITL